MLHLYFHRQGIMRRHRVGPLAPVIDGFAAYLHARRYARKTARPTICMVSRLSRYAQQLGVSEVASIDEALMTRFLRSLRRKGPFDAAPAAIMHLTAYLRLEGILPPPKRAASSGADPVAATLDQYDSHLVSVRGASDARRVNLRRAARRFLIWIRCRRPRGGLAELRGRDVLAYLSKALRERPTVAWRKRTVTEVRMFLRFLSWQGITKTNLERVVPKIPSWRLSTVPRHLPWTQVRSLVDGIDTLTPKGKRDKAILLLLAVLGMRGREVARVELRDIDWRAAEIRIPKSKTDRGRVLPVPHEVGKALADYILRSRPRIERRQVFLRSRAPDLPLEGGNTIGVIAANRLRRAGITAARPGSGLLRHSLATRMVNTGVPIKQIADVLGHQSIDTTNIYAKVDLARLVTVPLAFPSERRA